MLNRTIVGLGRSNEYLVKYIEKVSRKPSADKVAQYMSGESIGSEDGGGREVGFFCGKGAEALGLTSKPIVEGDRRLISALQGYIPLTDTPLRRGIKTQRVYKNRKKSISQTTAALDFTFTLPKDASILAASGSDETFWKINAAGTEAIKAVVDELQKMAGYTRTGAGGKYREKAGLIIAIFPHFISREKETLKHFHCIVVNGGVKGDGSTGALDSRRLFKQDLGIELGQKFRDISTSLISEAFDSVIPFERTPITNGYTYEVPAIPQSLRDAFSTRSKQIKKELGDNLHPTRKEREAAVLRTRPKKDRVTDIEPLRKKWREVSREHDFDTDKFIQEQKRKHDEYFFVRNLIESKAALIEESLKPSYEQDQVLKNPYYSALEIKKNVRSGYARSALEKTSERVSLAQTLREKIRSLIPFRKRDLEEQITTAMERRKKDERKFRRWSLYLYATGKISRSKYMQFTTGKGLPKTYLGIEFSYWTGQIKLSQRLSLHKKHKHKMPTRGVPKKAITIKMSYALGQITRTQKLIMLRALEKKREKKRAFEERQEKLRILSHLRGHSPSR